MAELGYKFTCCPPDVDEAAIEAAAPADPVLIPLHVARAKAEKVALAAAKPQIVIAADQLALIPNPPDSVPADRVFVRDGVRYSLEGKPASPEAAMELIARFSGHRVITISAVVVANTGAGVAVEATHEASLDWHVIPAEAQRAAVHAEGSFLQSCCGAVAYDDQVLRDYVKQLTGGHDSILGLPKQTTARLIRDVGGPEPPVAPEARVETSVAVAVAAHG